MKTISGFIAALFHTSRISAGLSLILGFWIFLGTGEVMGQCQITVPSFTSTGSQQWTVPAGVTSITVDVWGAGGGGSRRSGSDGASGGGGGGAFSRSILTVTPGSTLTIYVGNGGSSGADGQNSWVSTTTSVANAIILAEGGQSPGDNSNNGDRGGRSSNGIFNQIGFNGGDGANRASSTRGGGGGGAAGPSGNGGNASGRTGGTGNGDGGNGGTANNNDDSNGNPGLTIGGGGNGAARNTGNRAGGAGARGEVRISYSVPFCSEIISADFGSSPWCAGETRNVTVTIRNAGTATWTDSSPDINIGVKWNTNGANWADYYVRTNAENLAPGQTQTYTLALTASNNVGAGYTTPLTAGTNNLTFDVVNEGNFWFGNTSGNSVYTSSNITILAGAPTGLSYSANGPLTYCAGVPIPPNNASTTGGSTPTGYSVSPALPAGLSLNTTTGQITGTPSTTAVVPATNYTITASNSCGSTTRVLNIAISPAATVNVGSALPTICQGGSSAPLGGGIGGSATGGTWSSSAGGSFSPNATTLNATWTPPAGYSGTATLTLTTSGASCGSISASKSITVTANKSASTPATVTVCAVSGDPNIVHTTQGVTGIGAATGLPNGVTASFSVATGNITISGNPTQLGTFNYSIPLVGTCGPDANATGTIIVQNCACEVVLSSSGTWTVPNGVISIIVEAWGGGGRGGSKTSNDGRGGGGGGGAYSRRILTVGAGNVYYYNVGQGAPASQVTTPPPGGDSWFSVNFDGSSPSLLAKGGSSVNNLTSSGNSNGATGGQASAGVGDVLWNGGNGANGSSSGGGGGGSSAGPSANGNSAATPTGAIAPVDGGNGGDGTNNNAPGGNAPGIGGGGGGARRNGNNQNGGAGGNGQIKITYTLNAGVITGNQSICLGATTTLSSNQAGGTWSSANTAIATVNPTTGVVTGVGVGSATIRYTIVGSCAIATSTRTVFVNQPINSGTINGNQEICIGGTSQFTSTTSSGTWSSDNTAIATVSSTGLVTGLTAGTTIIRYTLPSSGGCPPAVATRTITVTAPPVAGTLSGTQAVCVGGTSAFSSTSPGGTWSSNNTGIATVNPTSGVVTGVTQGTATLTYTVADTGGCTNATATRSVTVTAAPNAGTLSGTDELCEGEGTVLSSTIPGGTWSSSNTAIASVNSSTGEVTALTSGTVTITYTVAGTGGCADATATHAITVYALPNPTFTAQPSSDVCVGALVTYSTQTGQFDYDWDVNGIEGTDYTITSGGIGSTSNSVTLIWLTDGPKEVSVNYSNANGCSATSSVTNSITINPLPEPTFIEEPSNPTCIGDEVTYTTEAGETNYTWNITGIEGIDYNITGGGIGTSSNTVTLEWLTDGSKTVTVNYENASGCAISTPATNTIDLAPLPEPTFTAEPSDPACLGAAYTYTTQAGYSDYVWSVSGAEGSDYNITAGGIGTSSNTVTIQWLTDGTKTVTVNYSDANGCTGVSPASNTIVLSPLPAPSFTVEPSTPVCLNDAVTYTTESGQLDYDWDIPGTENIDYTITGGGIGAGNNSVTLEWLTSGTKTVTVNYSDANGCSVPSPATNTIEVSIYTSIDAQPDPDQSGDTECFGDGFDPIFVSATGSNLTYQWYQKPDNSAIGTDPGTAIPGATLATFTPPSTPEGISYYYVIVSGTCGAPEISDLTGAYIVSPSGTSINTDLDSAAPDEEFCFGAGTFSQLEISATGDGGIPASYQWYQNTSPDNTGGVLLTGETNSTFTPPSDASVADGLPRYYYATATSASCGTVTSSISGAFIVTPLTSIDSENLTGETICEGQGPFSPISVSASGTGTLSYQWYSNTTGVINTAVDTQVGSDSNEFTPPSDDVDGISRYYYVVVSSTDGCGPDAISSLSGNFVVNPINTVSGPSSTPSECINNAIPDITHTTTSATGIGTPSGLPAGVTAIWSANVITISGTPTESGNFNYSIPLTGGCGTVAATGTITVTPDMTSSSIQPNGIACINQSLAPITHTTTLATGIGAPTGLPAGVTANWEANVITISGSPTVSGTFNYSIPLTGGCGSEEATGTITVTPDMTVTSAEPNGTTCINQALTPINHTSTLATGIGTPTGLPAGVTANWAANVITISGSPTASGTFNYSIPLIGGCGTVAATGTITVTPNMTVTSAQPNATICLNQALTAISHTTTQATGIGTPTGLPTGVTATWNANEITISGAPNVIGTFNYSIPLTGGCGTVAATGTITINPRPEITDIISPPICSGQTFLVTPTNGTNGLVPTGTLYTWTVSNNSNVTGESNQATPQTSISQTLTNTSTSDQTVTYTVTPITPAGCDGNTFEVEVIVKPTPTVNDPANQAAVCSGTPSTAVNFSGNGVSGVLYNWTNDTPSIGLPASGTGNIPSFITQNSGSGPVTATITVTPTANGCSGPSQTFTITVNPSPVIALMADYCSVGGSVQLIASSNVTGTTWLWNTGETTSSVLVDIAGLYSVTATSPNGCTSTTSISVAEELVVDGSFTNFNPASPSFDTEYTQNQSYYVDGDGSTGLWPEGYYAVNENANGSTTTSPPGYHTYFYGRDHTNNATGPRNFMMVNGGELIGSPLRQPIIWEQTVTVEPNTEYYFSAWAMNLNPGSPAKLQFEINGELVGSILDLSTAPMPTSAAEVGLDNWREFRSDPSWSSGSATEAVIRIVNLNTVLGGNDFALDDISFGTLSPFIKLTSAAGTDDSQVVCEDSPIVDVEYAVGGGLDGPIVENLPPGVNSIWNGVNLRLSGIPTTAGTYNFTVYTTGACAQVRAEGTIIVRDTPSEGTIASDQTLCLGDTPATIIGDIYSPQETGGVISYRWEMNTDLSTPNWIDVPGNPSSSDFNPPLLSQTTQYRRYTISTVNGLSCEGPASDPVTITLQSEPIAGTIAADQTICAGADPAAFTSTDPGSGDGTITYIWQSRNSSNPVWTPISGATNATYDSPALTETTEFQRLTISTLNGVQCVSVPSNTVTVTVTPVNTVVPINPDPPLCLNVPQPVTIIHSSSGATGIANEGIPGANGLPLGISAAFNSSTGDITISGTPTEVGIFNYNIPLTGGCGSVNATGTITVDNPTYPIVTIEVENPAAGSSPPYTSTFTVYSNELTPGTYEINYSLSGANAAADQTISVSVITPGEFEFESLPYSNEGTTILTINSIREISDLCPYSPPNNNTAPYGINCSTEFLEAGGDATYSVPAGVTEVSIQVYGNGTGGNTASQTITVVPGGQIFLVFDASDNIYATELPASEPAGDRLAQAIVATTGPSGRFVFTYDCTPPPACSASGDVFEYTDSEGYTVIRFTGNCSWTAPDGLDEFEVLVVGGGGGGGFGEAAGGGGGGAVIYQHYTGITMNGIPGLQGAVFQVSPGGQGSGASSPGQQGENGGGSSFTGSTFVYAGGNTFSDLSAAGGGGGGSSSTDPNIRNGRAGASGGGGAAFGANSSSGGAANSGNTGGVALGQSFGGAGAGGGGVSTGGSNGTGNASLMSAGTGGNGEMQTISGENIYYGAGGGGTSVGATVNEPGMGGSQYTGAAGATFYAGGRGNNTGLGLPATTYGSGGGAGRTGGSDGFQGVVYIRYPNFRILPIEYLYFNAKYNSTLRTGDLAWATAKEWENDSFVIERSVNNVNDWVAIGQVNGEGYADRPTEYTYQDIKLPLAGGNIYYRLKQLDFDGDSSYSVTKSIQIDPLPGHSYWRVFPNPTTGDAIVLELLNNEVYQDEEVTIRIISPTGHFDTGTSKAGITLNTLVSQQLKTKAPGLYTLEISWGDFKEYHKVILRR